MFHHLSKKDKKQKRIEARKRAILWSEKELRKKQLRINQDRVNTLSINESPKPSSSSISSEVQSIISQKPTESTVSSLRQTIKDLKVQRQELDTTIRVLTNYMEQLSIQATATSTKKRYKSHGN